MAADALLGTVLRHVRRLALPAHTLGLSDAQLLDRFRCGRDEAAFAALMQRHGGLVWSVCRHLLGDAADAEDAFQAVFLILARQAGSIRKGEAVASWLHGTAYRVAHRAKRDAARRRNHERRALLDGRERYGCLEQGPSCESAWRELQSALDEEVQNLPERHRAVFVLCVLEGKSHAEAAAALGWKQGTVSGTLARARQQLRGQLERRGISLSALLAGLGLVGRSEAALPLAQAALQTALGDTVPPKIAVLVQGVTGFMYSTKLKLITFLLLALAVVAGAAVARQEKQPLLVQVNRAVVARLQEKAKSPADAQGDSLPPGAVGRLGTIRFRHAADVDAFALSADGKTLATTSQGTVFLHEAATGKELRRIEGSWGAVHSIAFTPNGMSVVFGATDNSIRLCDVAKGKEVLRFTGHQSPPENPGGNGPRSNGVGRLLFSADGKVLVSRAADNTIRIWTTTTGKELRRIEGVPGVTLALDLSSDGRTIAAATGEFLKGKCDVRLWETSTGKEIRRLPHPGAATCVAFSPDGKTLATGSGPKGWDRPSDVILWQVDTGREIRSLRGHRWWVTAVAFSSDGKTLASGSYDGTPRLWNVKDGKELAKLGNGRMPVYSLAFSLDDKKLLMRTGNVNDHVVRIWDVASRKEVLRLAGHQSYVSALAFSADSKHLASGSADATVALWDVADRKERHHLPAHQTGVCSVAFSSEGRVLSAGVASNVHSWDAKTGKEGRGFDTRDGYFGRMAFSPTGKVVASWGRTGNAVRLTDVASGKELRQLAPVSPWVNGLAFSPDGSLLAIGTGQGQPFVTLWEVKTGQRLNHFVCDNWVLSLAFSPDGRTLASGHDDNKVRIWEVASGGLRFAFDHDGRPASLAFSPDGALLASCCNESISNTATNGFTPLANPALKGMDKIRLWDPFTGTRLHTLSGHRGAVVTLAFSPDGRLFASGSNDTSILLWDATKLPRARLKKGNLDLKKLTSLWADLAGSDTGKAHFAMRQLVGTPSQTVELFKDRVRPGILEEAKQVERLIAELDSSDFATRESASKELARRGAGAEPALRKALAGKPSLEAYRRIERLLRSLDGQHIGAFRAVEVLERLNTSEARKLLESLARGAMEARLTREAKSALQRLSLRPSSR